MADQDRTAEHGARQEQSSQQSARQGEDKNPRGKQDADVPAGIGSSQGQDTGSTRQRDRPSAGTPDIERGAGHQDVERGESRDSLVNDPTGAYSERP